MAKLIHTVNQFAAGINSQSDPRDLPEGGVSDAVNVMCDVEGRIRQMSRDKIHPDFFATSIASSNFHPGYGIFIMKSDQRMTDNVDQLEGIQDKETIILVYQNSNHIGFYDISDNANILELGPLTGSVKPAFMYSLIDGGLRICDSNYNNIVFDDDGNIDVESSNILTKYIKFMKKKWFADTTVEVGHQGWISGLDLSRGLDAFIYPPTVYSYVDANEAAQNPILAGADGGNDHTLVYSHVTDSGNAVTVGNLSPGNITIKTGESSSAGDSDWLAQTMYNFGISINYEGGQESPVTNFVETWGDGISDDTDTLTLQVFFNLAGSNQDNLPFTSKESYFDSRITGFNVYLTGDDAGMYEDPYFLAEMYFGSSAIDKPRLTTSDGSYTEKFTIDATSGTINNTNAITIIKTPVVTFSMRNGYPTDTKSIACSFKTAAITNRRAYIAGIRRFEFDTHNVQDESVNQAQNNTWRQPKLVPAAEFTQNDSMLVSPVDYYDIFPNENLLNVGSNDGDHVIKLIAYSDRIFQFKQNILYIINVSEDLEYVESENRFMGIKEPYQAVKIKDGVVWINSLGCYLYDSEGSITNLIEGKLDKGGVDNVLNDNSIPSWKAFVGDTAMVGYIAKLDQIVIFQNPTTTTDYGNILIYDIFTESWTRGFDRVTGRSKSNITNDYDSSLFYATVTNSTTEQLDVSTVNFPSTSMGETWQINGIDTVAVQANSNGSQLLLNSAAITPVMYYPADVEIDTVTGLPVQTFLYYLIDKIKEEVGEDAFFLTPVNNNGDAALLIERPGDQVDGTYTGGGLSWSTASSMGAVVTGDAVSIDAPISDNTSVNFFYGPTTDGGVVDPYNTLYPDVGTSIYDHQLHIEWLPSPNTPPGYLIRHLSKEAHLCREGFDLVNGDEPRMIISNNTGSNWTWVSGSGATLTVDLYSDTVWGLLPDSHAAGALAATGQFSGNIGARKEFTPFSSWNCDLLITDTISTPTIPGWGASNVGQSIVVVNAEGQKITGSGEDSEHSSDSAIKTVDFQSSSVPTNYYLKESCTFQLPSAIFKWQVTDFTTEGFTYADGDFSQETGVGEYFEIILIGNWAHVFAPGARYTIGNVESAAAVLNKSFILHSISVHHINDNDTSLGHFPGGIGARWSDVYWGADEDPVNQARFYNVTKLFIKRSTNIDTGTLNASEWLAFINWTSFNTLTFTGNSADITLQTNTVLATVSDKKELAVIPRRRDGRSNVFYNLQFHGDDGQEYFFSHQPDGTTADNFSIARKMADNMKLQHTDSMTAPFYDAGIYQLPSAERLFGSNGVGITTTALSNSETQPWNDVAVGCTGADIRSILRKNDILLVREVGSTNYEIVTVTNNSGTGIISRGQYGTSAVNFGSSKTLHWFKLRAIKQVSSSQLEVLGDDVTSIFVEDAQFRLDELGNDTGGGNAYSGVNLSHYTLNSEFDADNNKTVINIKTTLSHTTGEDNTGDVNLNGTNASVYFAYPDIGSSSTVDDATWVDTLGGAKPGSEMISVEWTPFWPTPPGAGYEPYTNNILSEIASVRMLGHDPDHFSDYISASGSVSDGIEIRHFKNDLSDSLESHSGSYTTSPYVITPDLTLDEDIVTKKVLYEVKVTAKSSEHITVSYAIDGSSNFINMYASNQVSNTSFTGQGANASYSTRSYYFSPTLQTQSSFGPRGLGRRSTSVSSHTSAAPLKYAQTVKIKVDGGINAFGFEVNDISIVYRPLDTGR